MSFIDTQLMNILNDVVNFGYCCH